MFKRIDHVGVAVRSLEEAAKKFEELLGLTVADREEVAAQHPYDGPIFIEVEDRPVQA